MKLTSFMISTGWQKENHSFEPKVDLTLWLCSFKKTKKNLVYFFFLYKDLVGHYIANPGSDRRHFIVLCSERRTSISLVVNRAITYGQIKSINNQPLMDDTLVNHMPLLNTGNSDSHALNRNVLHS